MKAFFDRFKEPSSWSGLGLLLGAFGLSIDQGLLQAITVALSGASGLASVLVKEKGNR